MSPFSSRLSNWDAFGYTASLSVFGDVIVLYWAPAAILGELQDYRWSIIGAV
jgi:hypothetical protein